MKKILLLLSMFVALPIQNVMAATYYEENSKLKIDFPDGWYEFSEELYKEVGREQGVAFTTEQGQVELYVETIEKSDTRLQTINKLIEHIKSTKEERQKPERYIRSLQSSYGMDISEYKFNSNYTRLTLEMVQTSKSFGEIDVVSEWVLNEENVYELKIFKFERTKNMNEQIQYIIDSVKIGDEMQGSAQNSMEQGGTIDGKVVAESDQNNTIVGDIFEFLNSHTVWWAVIIVLVLFLLGIVVYKLA